MGACAAGRVRRRLRFEPRCPARRAARPQRRAPDVPAPTRAAEAVDSCLGAGLRRGTDPGARRHSTGGLAWPGLVRLAGRSDASGLLSLGVPDRRRGRFRVLSPATQAAQGGPDGGHCRDARRRRRPLGARHRCRRSHHADGRRAARHCPGRRAYRPGACGAAVRPQGGHPHAGRRGRRRAGRADSDRRLPPAGGSAGVCVGPCAALAGAGRAEPAGRRVVPRAEPGPAGPSGGRARHRVRPGEPGGHRQRRLGSGRQCAGRGGCASAGRAERTGLQVLLRPHAGRPAGDDAGGDRRADGQSDAGGGRQPHRRRRAEFAARRGAGPGSSADARAGRAGCLTRG